MISFKILSSPDYEINTQTYTYYQNIIYLGFAQGHFFIKDSELIDNHLMLEVLDNDLLLHPNPKIESFLIDGKRATSVRKLKINQIVTIGNTQIQILDFKNTEHLTRKEILDAKLNQILERDDSRLTIIEKLSGLMKS